MWLLPVILSEPAATPRSVVLGSRADLLGTNGPGIAETHGIRDQFVPAVHQVVLRIGVEVAAQPAKFPPVTRGRRYLQETDTVPQDFDTQLSVDHYAVQGTVDFNPVGHLEWDLNSFAVDLDSHPLT